MDQEKIFDEDTEKRLAEANLTYKFNPTTGVIFWNSLLPVDFKLVYAKKELKTLKDIYLQNADEYIKLKEEVKKWIEHLQSWEKTGKINSDTGFLYSGEEPGNINVIEFIKYFFNSEDN